MNDFISKIKTIKRICHNTQYCYDLEKRNCPFYDKNSGYCIFGETPELWDITKNIEDQINKAFEKEGAKNDD